MQLCFSNKQDFLPCQNPEETLKNLASLILEGEQEACDEISFLFVDLPTICDLHEEFFQDPSPTDCCTFPMDGPDEPYRVLGEVVVCPEVAEETAEKEGLNPYHELTLYCIHGILHLLGYDDIEEQERKLMKKQEKLYLSQAVEKKLVFTPSLTS